MDIHCFFTGSETWSGGYYELALELGERSDSRLLSALSTLWSHPDIEGMYSDRDVEPQEQQKITTSDVLQFDSLYGIVQLPNNTKIACASFIVREDDVPDWLALCLPLGSLSTAYNVGGYPFEADGTISRHWRDVLNTWLAQIGMWVFQDVKYRLGIIGMEVSGEIYAEQIQNSGVQHRSSDTGLLWPENGTINYYPNSA